MSAQVVNLIRRATEPKPSQYNILTFPTHERFETDLCKTGHNFYGFSAEGLKRWDTAYAKIPDNYYLLPEGAIFQGISFDFIL